MRFNRSTFRDQLTCVSALTYLPCSTYHSYNDHSVSAMRIYGYPMNGRRPQLFLFFWNCEILNKPEASYVSLLTYNDTRPK